MRTQKNCVTRKSDPCKAVTHVAQFWAPAMWFRLFFAKLKVSAADFARGWDYVVDEGAIPGWLDSPNEAFGGFKPLEVIKRGEVDRLRTMIYQLESGAASSRRRRMKNASLSGVEQAPGTLVGLTSIARATVAALQMNRTNQ